MEKRDAHYPYRMAEIKKSGDRTYIEFWAWSEAHNRLVRKRFYRFGGKTDKEKEKEAKKTAREVNRLLAQGFVLDPEVPGEVFPKELWPALHRAASIRLIGATYHVSKSLRQLMARLEEYLFPKGLDKMDINNWSKANSLEFLDFLRETRNISNRTRNNYRDSLVGLFQVLVDREHLDKNPAAGIKPLKSKSATHKAFSKEQQEVLESYLKINNYGLYVFTRLIYHGFLRPVEILRLRVSDVDLENDLILILAHQAKNKKQMPVVIPPPLKTVMEDYFKKYRPPEYMYLFSKGFRPGMDPWHRNRFSEAHKKALKATGLYDGLLTGYSWKHTGVCNAYRAGLDIKSIQAQCRHHSLQETETYLRSLGLRTHGNIRKVSW